MADLSCSIPTSLLAALETRAKRGDEGISHVVTAALSNYLAEPIHTLFQVSTSGALVAGVYTGAVSCKTILQHGDLGLGTFEKLQGEMVVLEGRAYQVRSDGKVLEAPSSAAAPFAVVTRFAPEIDLQIGPAPTLDSLTSICDEYRRSNNIFFAVRLDGPFLTVRTRAIGPPPDHGRLIDAAKTQAEFEFSKIRGTLVGLWSPGFSSAFSIPGYHFHFLSDDRQRGGHLLACSSSALRLRMETLTDFHLALPETESFLKADLSKNTANELAYAEQAH